MKKAVLLLAAALGLGLIWYFFRAPAQSSPINLLSPQGGETWEIGSAPLIRWTSKNLPETYQIAINLRRAVSSDKLTEGQEFDPVLFVGLPNTGQVAWEIADHYPEGDYFINLLAYESLPITDEAFSVENKTAFRLVRPEAGLNWQTYNNEDFGYQLKYPDYLTVREFSDIKTGADFYLPGEDAAPCITVSARASGGQSDLAFAEYVKVAAIEEIQGFEKLESLEPITTSSGITGYKTTWAYRVLAQPEQISLPITYFAGPGLVQDSNYKTIQINLNNSECADSYGQMIQTFVR